MTVSERRQWPVAGSRGAQILRDVVGDEAEEIKAGGE